MNRASLVFEGIEEMYQAAEFMLKHPLLNQASAHCVEFADRFRAPLAGGYRDIQLLLRVRGVVTEVQLTTAGLLQAKEEEGGHKNYRTERFVREWVLLFAIEANLSGLEELLRVEGVRDN